MVKQSNDFQIYQDAHGQWRWWCFDDEGNISSASESGFDKRADCEQQAIELGYLSSAQPKNKLVKA